MSPVDVDADAPKVGVLERPSFPGALSIPSPGRTIVANTEPLAEVMRNAVDLVSQDLRGPEASQIYRALFAPRAKGLDTGVPDPHLIAWSTVGVWAVIRTLDRNSAMLSLADAERRFFGPGVASMVALLT